MTYSSFFRHRTLEHDRTAILQHDDVAKATDHDLLLILPQTIAAYLAAHASLVIAFCMDTVALETLIPGEVAEVWKKALETETEPRRFFPRRWLSRLTTNDPEDAGTEGT